MNEPTVFPLITDPDLQAYCDAHSTQQLPLQAHIESKSLATGKIQMISGKFLGQYLRMMSLLLRPRRILEVGTFTGYGTSCLSAGLQPDGLIYTLEKSSEYKSLATNNLETSPQLHQIRFLEGDAAELISGLDEVWDLVFLDAAKRQYINYYDLVFDKLKVGGVILADNVLWKGKVGHPENDKLGEGLDAFNKMVMADERVDNIVLPIDDGLNFIIKR